MKKLIALLAVLALIFALFGCADGETQTEPSEASSTSDTTGTTPQGDDIYDGLSIPSLTVLCDDSSFPVHRNSISWHEALPDGKMTGVNADSDHPKNLINILQHFVLPSFEGKTATLSFDRKPNRVSVTSYPIGADGKVADGVEPTEHTLSEGNAFPLADDTLYIVNAAWNDPDCGGTVNYAFTTDCGEAVVGRPQEHDGKLNIPDLTVFCGESTVNVHWHGGSWYNKDFGEKMSAINIDSLPPKDCVVFLPRFILPSFDGKTATLSFSQKPDDIYVTSYPVGGDGKVSKNAKPTKYTLSGDFTFPLTDHTVYDIIGKWNDPECGGTITYAFVTDSTFTALDYANKTLYEKYPALKTIDPSCLSVSQHNRKDKGEYGFTYTVCIGDMRTYEQYTILITESKNGYELKEHYASYEGEYSAFCALATPERLANAKEDIIEQVGDSHFEPAYALYVTDGKLLLQAERIVDIVTPASLLGQSGCNIDHKHMFYTATVCEK